MQDGKVVKLIEWIQSDFHFKYDIIYHQQEEVVEV